MSISSADSLLSASAAMLSSFPFSVVWGLVAFWMTGSIGLLDEGVSRGKVCSFSDIVVGSFGAFSCGYSGWGARIFWVSSCCSLSVVSTCIVVCSSSTSSCNLRMAATIFVCVYVDGGVSIYSMHFALYLAFSCLLFMFYSMSRMSTGCGGSSCVG